MSSYVVYYMVAATFQDLMNERIVIHLVLLFE